MEKIDDEMVLSYFLKIQGQKFIYPSSRNPSIGVLQIQGQK